MSCIRYVAGPCSPLSCLAEPLASCFSVCAEVSMLHSSCNPVPSRTGQQGYQSCPGKPQACRAHGAGHPCRLMLGNPQQLDLHAASPAGCCRVALLPCQPQGLRIHMSRCLCPTANSILLQHRATSLTTPCITPQASQQLQAPDFAALCQVCCLQGHQFYPYAAVQLQAASPVPQQLCLLHHSRPLTHCQHLQTTGAGRLVRLWPVAGRGR